MLSHANLEMQMVKNSFHTFLHELTPFVWSWLHFPASPGKAEVAL